MKSRTSVIDSCANNKQKEKDLVKFFSLFLLSIFALVLLSGVGSASALNYSVADIYQVNVTSGIFNGSTFINVSSSNSLHFHNRSFALLTFFKTNNQPTTSGIFIGKDGGGSSTTFDLFIDTAGRVNPRIAGTGAITKTGLFDNKRYLGGGSFDRDFVSQDVRPFLNNGYNGSNVDISSFRQNNMSNNLSLYIGRRPAGNFYNGTIYQTLISNRSLADEVVNNIYKSSIYGENIPRIPVIYYHEVDDAEPFTDVSKGNFSLQMAYLNSSGYRTISYKNYLDYRKGNYTLPAKPVIINFDDAKKSIFLNATAIMNNYSFTATLGVITNLVGSDSTFMNWSDIQNLSNQGWEIASHSTNHVSTSHLSPTEMNRTFRESKQAIIGNLSVTPLAFIYPYNNYSLETSIYCEEYYLLCTANNSGSTSPLYMDKDSDLIFNGIYRVGIYQNYNNWNFRNAVNPYNDVVLNIEFNTFNTTFINDSSGFQNNGNATGLIILNETLNFSRGYIKYKSSSDYDRLFNENYNTTYNISLYQLTNSLIYFSNNSLACSDIATCDNNINITLTPNNFSYVLDNFNLTEGVTRQFSPLSISGSSTSKTITSSLTDSITATVVVNVAQCSFSATYEGDGVNEDSCIDNIATFTLTDIPAQESELQLSYLDINCDANTSAGSVIILIFTALAIMSISLFLVIKRDELTIQILLVAFITIMVGIALFIQIAQNLGGVCA